MKKYVKKIVTAVVGLAVVMTTVLAGISNNASAAVWKNVYSSKGMVTVAAGQPFEVSVSLKTYGDIAWKTTLKSLFSYTLSLRDSAGNKLASCRVEDSDVRWVQETQEGEFVYIRSDAFNGYKAGKYTVCVEFDADKDIQAAFSAQTLDTSANMPTLKDQEITAGFKTTLAVKDDTITKCVSSDKKIVSVTSKGVVTGKKKGTATIRITTAKGTSLSCNVKVNANVHSQEKITKKDVSFGAYSIKPYHAKYDSKGNLVVKAMAINNGVRKVKVSVWTNTFKNIARTDKMPSVTMPANSARSVTLRFSKASMRKQKLNLPVDGLWLFAR